MARQHTRVLPSVRLGYPPLMLQRLGTAALNQLIDECLRCLMHSLLQDRRQECCEKRLVHFSLPLLLLLPYCQVVGLDELLCAGGRMDI